MKKIYIVVSGDYSDYHIVAVYSTEKLAAACVEKIKNGDIEVYGVDTEKPPPEDYSYYYVEMARNGDAVEIENDGSEQYSLEATASFNTFLNASGAGGRGTNRTTNLGFFTCWAKDKKHAVKIINEIRIQMIANNEWDIPDGT